MRRETKFHTSLTIRYMLHLRRYVPGDYKRIEKQVEMFITTKGDSA